MRRKIILLSLLSLILAACGTVATPVFQADLEETQVAAAATAAAATANAPTFTPTPSITPTATDTPLPSNTPTDTATPLPTDTPLPPTEAPTQAPAAGSDEVTGDPVHGEELFNTFQAAAGFACATCHLTNTEAQLIGPGLLNVSIRAATRVPGESAKEYIHNSIVDPNAYVVDGFPANLMPRNWADIYSEADINDIIAYLFTLKG